MNNIQLVVDDIGRQVRKETDQAYKEAGTCWF